MAGIKKLDLKSKNITENQKAKLKELFPEVFTENKIDFGKLRLTLGGEVDDGEERFGMTWPGKRDCFKVIQEPSIGTLKPCRDESVNWDKTKNLFIEGDNLEVLKLLQKSYYGKVKVVCIDPPYNTGNEFIYPDKYSESLETYFAYTRQVDAEGRKFSTNTEADGRFHSKWLNMMYPRLFLGRNLLRDDGVIFISIDDNEMKNLRTLCDEIFGEENHLGTLIWKNATDNNPTNIAVEHEYILVYSKSKNNIETVWKSNISDVKQKLIEIGNTLVSKYKIQEVLQATYTKWFRNNKYALWPLDRYKYIDDKGVYTGSQSVHNPGKEGYRYDVIHPRTGKACKEPLMGYRFPKETMDNLLKEEKVLFGKDETKIIELKVYAYDYEDKLASVIDIDGRLGAYDLRNLFSDLNKAFTNPKPVRLLRHFIPFILKSSEDIILDFFSGSCTTAHAAFDLNKQDNGNRNFIMVQLPEPCDEKSEAYKSGYKTIADIGKERIRRVIKKIEKEQDGKLDFGEPKQDLGFKVFKLDKSNFKIWDGNIAHKPIQEQLKLAIDHIDPNSKEEDIFHEVLLKSGFELTTPVEELTLEGKKVYSVAEGALLICLEKKLTKNLIRAIAKKEPHRVVCLDSGFKGNDQLKTNAVQIMKSFKVESFRTV